MRIARLGHGVSSSSARCIHCAFAIRKQLFESIRRRPAFSINWAQRHSSTQDLKAKPSFRRRVKAGKAKNEEEEGKQDVSSIPRSARPVQGRHGAREDDIRNDQAPSKQRNSRRRASPRSTDRHSSRIIPHSSSKSGSVHRQSSAKHSHQQRFDFKAKLTSCLQMVQSEIEDSPLLQVIAKERGAELKELAKELWRKFERPLKFYDELGSLVGTLPDGRAPADVLADLRTAFTKGGSTKLKQSVMYNFLDTLLTPRFSEGLRRNQEQLADLRYPTEWYPETRMRARKFHMHVGPTNSGKTYQALKRLEEVEGDGVYAGPLRLLAQEVYSRFNAKGLPCYLATGEERRAPIVEIHPKDNRKLASCTVEMLPLYTPLDICVIDEIQMISDPHRGWAWTQAVLGVQAKEVHLCGEERAVPLMQQICASLGEELVIHRYERLSPLLASRQSLGGDMDKLRKGDCVVSFSVVGIHALKKLIEDKTGRKVAVVYGALPAETRAQQARLFNDPDNDYDILVASDAIGMGLNLAIKRVIFETVAKRMGSLLSVLDVAQIKQIAGRAGRYRTAQKDETGSSEEAGKNRGFVTTLDHDDLKYVQKAMDETPPPLTKAGIVPTNQVVTQYAAYFPPETPFSYILQKLWVLSKHSQSYFVCGIKDMVWIADTIESIPLTVRERYTFCALPIGGSPRNLHRAPPILKTFARAIAEQKSVSIVDMPELPLELLDKPMPDDDKKKSAYLEELENLHRYMICYMWLSFRFAGVFMQRSLAKHVSELAEVKIAEALSSIKFDEEARTAQVLERRRVLRKQQMMEEEEAMQMKHSTETEQQDLSLSADIDVDQLGLEDQLDCSAGVDDAQDDSVPRVSDLGSDEPSAVLPLDGDNAFDTDKPGLGAERSALSSA